MSSTLTYAFFTASGNVVAISSLSGTVSSLSGVVSSVSGAVAQNTTEINTMSGRVDTLSGAVNVSISGQVSSLSGKVETLSGGVLTLSGNVNTLSGLVADATNSVYRVKWTTKTTAELTADILSNSSNFLVLVDSVGSSDGFTTTYSALQSATPTFQGGTPGSGPGSNYIRLANISAQHKYTLTLDGVGYEIAPKSTGIFFFNNSSGVWIALPNVR
jgi:hypothetical protein